MDRDQQELTSVSDLTGISTSGSRTPLREGNPNLAEALSGCARPDALIPGQNDLLLHSIWALDLSLDGHNLIIEPALLLCCLGSLEAFGSILVHLFPSNTKITADILACPSHGLHAIDRLLALRSDRIVKGLFQSVTSNRHGLCTDGNTNVNVALGDRVGNVGGSLETGGAETVQRVCAGGVWDTGSQRSGAELVGRFAIGDLEKKSGLVVALDSGSSEQRAGKAYISQSDVLDKIRVDTGPLVHLLQQGIDDVFQARVFEATLPGLCERCPDGEGDDNIVGILGCPIFRTNCISRYFPL